MHWLPGSLATPTRQPVGATVAPDWRDGLLFCYSGEANAIIGGTLRTVGGTRPVTATPAGRALRAENSNWANINGSANAITSPVVTILVVGQMRQIGSVNALISKSVGSTGFEISLSNQFGTPANRVWSGLRKQSTGSPGNFQLGFVDGIQDSINGTFPTVAGRVYSIVAFDTDMTTTSGQDIRLGQLNAYLPTVDVLLGAVWVGRYFSRERLQSLSRNPWQLLASAERPLWAPPAPTAATVFRPGSDLIVNGWTPSTGSDLFAMLDEPTLDRADYITSPNVSDPATMGWASALPAGTYDISVDFDRTGATGQLRIVLLDAGGTPVGTSAWQTAPATAATTVFNVTSTGTSDRFRIEVQP